MGSLSLIIVRLKVNAETVVVERYLGRIIQIIKLEIYQYRIYGGTGGSLAFPDSFKSHLVSFNLPNLVLMVYIVFKALTPCVTNLLMPLSLTTNLMSKITKLITDRVVVRFISAFGHLTYLHPSSIFFYI